MRFHSVLIGALVAVLSVTHVSAEVRINDDPGGIISQHMNVFARLRDVGERVVIDGRCFSACTLVLGILPPDRVCVTSRAALGFHAAWVPDADGRQVHSELGTATMWNVYPTRIRRWIRSRGGLSRKTIVLRGRELTSLVQRCE